MRRTTGSWREPLVAYAGFAVVLWAVAWYSVAVIGVDTGPQAEQVLPQSWLDGWTRWDGGWYVHIARDGYYFNPAGQSAVVFFPAFPALIRGVALLVRPYMVAGIVAAMACSVVAVVAFDRWCNARLSGREAKAARRALLVYPYAFFLAGAVYSDALFLAAAVIAFTLLDADRPVLAGVAGALATAARPVGVVVVCGLVVRALERRGRLPWQRAVEHQRFRVADLGVLLSTGGVVAYTVFLQWRFGRAFAFIDASKWWGQPVGPSTWFKTGLVHFYAHRAFDVQHVSIAVQILLMVAALALVPTTFRRLGWGYGAYTLLAIVVPAVSTKDFMGMGRYLLAAFPLFAMAGVLLVERLPGGVRRVMHAASGAGLLVFTSLFARWYYVG
jgi:hypothetical protein